MTTEWYRNTTWNESVERIFEEKLRRARRKQQYLRVQACILAPSHPEVALKLLDRYFQFPIDIDHAQAHVDRATALDSLGRIEDAIVSYEAALAREAVFPNVRTHAYLGLPYLVATRSIRAHYRRALQILCENEARLVFRFEYFQWHAAQALIAAESRDSDLAKSHAERALEAAAQEHSGFRYHPFVGLVTKQYDDVVRRLQTIRAAS